MSYEKLNLKNGNKWEEKHVSHLEEGILNNESSIILVNVLQNELEGKVKILPGKIYNSKGEVFNDYENNIASIIYSHAEGEKTLASGTHGAHAEGMECQAIAARTHAEGGGTIASGKTAHAEGGGTIAGGQCSHAEGYGTVVYAPYSHGEGNTCFIEADARSSHAEGQGIIVASKYQHAQGKYNIRDSSDKHAHIVGNGTSDTNRSNAHTLDWEGNAWFAGNVEGQKLILTSPSGLRFAISVDDNGELSTIKL